MARFQIHILGCGSALPNLKHNTSSQLIEIHDKMFMIDCGEGTQLQLRKSKVHFSKIGAVFITHMHGDHCFGLMGLVSTFGLLGRTAPLHIYAPKEMQELFELQQKLFCSTFEYQLIFHPVETTENKVIYEDKSLTVTTIPLQHRVPCCGFLFKEKPRLPHINREMMDYYEVPQSQYNNIKNGADWLTADGTVVPNSRLTLPTEEPLSYAYCSDTRYIPTLHKQIMDVSALYHESTYTDADEKQAAKYCHSTARQAATVAKEAKAGMLMLGHYSSKYSNENIVLNEAKSVFGNSFLSNEMDVYDVEKQKKI
ncbi:ribonuclease Z [uncultured Prevotella sp.]|uniref:ribonuclease Z n=1 Tax=uncultured Prevotella sp. TaxID=159272 RepID=UPI0028053008|nr:ribonuclease Z [uncultured Prevotella sp.]